MTFAASRKSDEDIINSGSNIPAQVTGSTHLDSTPSSNTRIASPNTSSTTVDSATVSEPLGEINVDSTITVGDVNKIIECLKTNTLAPSRLMHLVNRLVPFAKSIPGTTLAFKDARKKLYSIVSSPVYDGKPFRWFVTMSNADKYEEYLYRWILNDGNGNVLDFNGTTLVGDDAETFLRSLTKTQRTKLLRDHPAMATRSFMIKQALIMRYIVNEDSTFGNYHDHWARIEFQRSLSAHIHMLISVHDEGLGAIQVQQGELSSQLADLIKKTCTAQVLHCYHLVKPH